jgi:hypothetical protein
MNSILARISIGSLQKEGSAYIMNNPIIDATTVSIGTADTTTTRSTSTKSVVMKRYYQILYKH